jgi:hypothetical protein
MADSSTDDFLEVPAEATPAYAEELATPRPGRRMPAAVTTGAWLVVGLLVGAIGVAALHSNTGSAANGFAGGPAATANQVPGAGPGQGFAGGAPPGGFGGPGGGLAGEQHVVGTLTAVGAASLTGQSARGTATYPIESSTVLVKGGQRASLSALTVGDTVVVHVYPQNGSTHVELVLDSDGATTET